MTRVATLAQHTLIQNTIKKTMERVFDRQAQIASGKETTTFQGISKETQRLVNFEARLERTNEFINQNKLIDARLQIMDSSLNGMFEISSQLKVRLIQRLDASTGSEGALAEEATNMLDSVVGLMNVQTNGRFLFSGSATNTQPVQVPVPDPTTFGVADDTYYQGDSVELSARVSESIDIQYGIPANRQGFQQLIGALKATIRGDQLNDEGLLNNALSLVDQAIDELNAYRNEGGSTGSVVARATSFHEDFRLYAEGVISDIENVDVTLAIAALTSDQTVLEASFITVGQISRLSLADFLR